jgi:hypothetical protein
MKSFFQFYQEMLREQAPVQAVPQAPVQGGQTTPPIPPNPLSNPNIQAAIKTLANINDPQFKNAFLQFQKAITPKQNPQQPVRPVQPAQQQTQQQPVVSQQTSTQQQPVVSQQTSTQQ